MLSRVQCLNQLFILESLPEEKMKAFPEALEEFARLQSLDISKPEEFNPLHFKIASLNTRSLNAHIEDIRKDQGLLSADVICLQETWLKPDEKYLQHFSIKGKINQLNNKGIGKGIATYYPSSFELQINITEDTYQLTSITSTDMIIINVYRSKHSTTINDSSLIESLKPLFISEKTIVICGDLNLCQRDDNKHKLLSFLRESNFIPSIDPPQPSHIDGRCLDQIHMRLNQNVRFNKTYLEPCYFSDHDKINIILNQISQKSPEPIKLSS